MDLGSQIPLIGEQNVIGGYDFEFLDKPSTGQVCSICLVAMRNPVQTTCGHRFCEECLLGTFREGNARICPQDRSPIPQEGGLFRDVAWERDILSLRVKCKRNERGCDWTEQLRHYQEHVTECRYEDVACANCNEDVQQRLLLAHETSECRNRIVQCEYCQEEFEFWRTEVHEGEECTLFPLDCPQQCGEREIPREELESHIRDDCLMTLLACPYNDAGCNFSDKRVNLEAHTKGSIEDHLRKTWTQLVATKEELKKINETEDCVMEIQGQVEQFQTKQRQVETSLQTSKDKNRELELLVRKLEQDNWCLRREVNGLTNQLAKSNRSLPQRIQSEKEERESAFEKNNKEIRDLKLTVGKLQMELTELKINTVSERLKAVVEQKERSRESVENTKDKMASFVLEAPISSSLPVYPQDSQLDGGKKSIEGIKKGEPYEERSQQHQLFSLLKPL